MRRRSALVVIALVSSALSACTGGGGERHAGVLATPRRPGVRARGAVGAVGDAAAVRRRAPGGWRFGGSLDRATPRPRLWLDHDRAGIHAVEVALERLAATSSSAVRGAARARRGGHAGLSGAREPRPASPGAVPGVRRRLHRPRVPRSPDGTEPTLVIEADRAVSTLLARDDRRRGREDSSTSPCAAPGRRPAWDRLAPTDADRPSPRAPVLARHCWSALVFMLVAVGRHPEHEAPQTTLAFVGDFDQQRLPLDRRHPERRCSPGCSGSSTSSGGGIVTIPLRAIVDLLLLFARRFVAMSRRSSSPGRRPSRCSRG